MKEVRPFDQQFSPTDVKRIQILIDNCGRLNHPSCGYGIYTTEIQGCLFSGLLLAATLTTTALLELFVRDLVVALRITKRFGGDMTFKTRIEHELEYDRGSTFSRQLQELSGLVIEQGDVQALDDFYDLVRTPLFHGLVRRLTWSEFDRSFEALGIGPSRGRKLEDSIEDRALDHVRFIIDVVLKYQPWLLRRYHEE